MIGGKFNLDVSGFAAIVTVAESRSITSKGVKAGILLLSKAAKSQAPRRKGSGALKQSQGILAKRGKRGTTVSFAVQGARKKFIKYVKLKGYKSPQKVVPSFYDHLVMGGARPHRLGTGEKLFRKAGKRRKEVAQTAQATGGKHPGSQPNPYRMRAWNSVKDQVGEAALKAMGAEFQKIIDRNAAKLKVK